MLPKNTVKLAVISPKGGTGKTTTTANLAVAMSELYKKYVLALDANFTAANLGVHLNITKPPITFSDVIKKDLSILDALYFYNRNLQVLHFVLPLEMMSKPIILQEKIKQVTDYYNALLSKLENKYDFIIIDSAPGFGVEAVAAIHIADALLLVTNPELPTMMVDIEAVEYAKNLKKPIIGIVLNKVKKKSYELNKKEVEDSFGIPVIAEVLDDPKVSESIAKRTPVVMYAKRSSASLAYRKLAADLLGERYKIDALSKIKAFLIKS